MICIKKIARNTFVFSHISIIVMAKIEIEISKYIDTDDISILM